MKNYFHRGGKFYVDLKRKICFLMLSTLFCASSTILAQKMQLGPGITVTCPADFRNMNTKRVMPDFSTPSLQKSTEKVATAQFEVTFGPGALANPELQAALQFALDIWASELVSSVPIRIFIDFTTFANPGVIAAASASYSVSNFPGAPAPDILYPGALANSLAGERLFPDQPYEIEVNFGDQIPFYYGTDGNTPSGEFDFVTIALHEVCHGLGFTTTRGFNTLAGTGTLRNGGSPSVFSLSMVDGDGNRLLDFDDPSVALGNAMTGGDLFVDGVFATAAFGGTFPELYAPPTFAGGSSIAHWDENVFPPGDPNSLMTPFAGQAESNFDVGAITRGHFKDMGWVLNDADAPQIVLSPNTISETMDVNTTLTTEIMVSSIADSDLTVTVSASDTGLITFPAATTFELLATETASFDVTFNTDSIVKGIYEEEIIFTVAGDENTLSIPVTLRVLDGTEVPVISVNPTAFSETLDQFSFITKDLTIDNTGDDNLNYSISIATDASIPEPVTTFAERVAISLNAIKTNGFEKVNVTTDGTLRTSNANTPIFQIDNTPMENLVTSLYATSFEEYEPGDIVGQEGWGGQFDGNWIISDENPFEGEQHFRGVSDGLGSTRNGFILALSPIFETTGDEPFTVFEAKVNVETGVTWEVIPATANPQTLATRLRFKPDGTIETLAGGDFVPVPGTTPTGYFDLKITVDRDDATFAVFFDNELVFSGQGNAVAIEQVILLSEMEIAGPTFDIDNFEITNGDENASFVSVTPAIGAVPFTDSSTLQVKFDARSLDPGTYTADIIIDSNDAANPSITVPVNLVVSQPPTIVVNPDALNAAVDVTIDDPAIKTATFTISNTGESDLNFESALGAIDFTGTSTLDTRAKLAALDMNNYGKGNTGVFTEKSTQFADQLAIAKASSEFEFASTFSDSIFYDSGIDFPDGFAGLVSGEAYTSAVRFEAPADFSLSAVRNGFTTETVTNPTIILEVYRGGATPLDGELLLTQTVEQSGPDGIVIAEVLDTPLSFAAGESFWIVHKYPLGIEFPQGTDENIAQRPNTYFFSGDAGTTFSPSSFVFFVRALSGGITSNYITLDPETATIAPGSSQEVTATFDGTSLANGVYETPILLQSNDPINPEVSVATTFTVSGQQSFIEVDNELLLFDNVFIGNEKEVVFTLTNSGLSGINITSITSDNTAFVIGDSEASLAPGASIEIPVTYIPESVGNTNGIITIISDADNTDTIEVIVNGVGVAPPIAVLAPDLVVTQLPKKSMGTEEIVLRNDGDAPLVYSFPEFAAAQLLANPNVQLNNTEYIDFGPISTDKNALDLRVGSQVLYSVGKDLEFGYAWIDSDEEGGPVYNFVDITETGIEVTDNLGGEDSQQVPINFPFEFYDAVYTDIYIGANGLLSFNELSFLSFINTQIPSADFNVSNAIAGFWSDLSPQDFDGSVHYQNFEDRFVVQYTNVSQFLGSPDDTVTFQMVLYPDGTIDFFYEDVSNASFLQNATVGIENADNTDGAQVAFNTAYVKDGLAVRFIKPDVVGATFITDVSSLSGVLPAGATRNITVTLDTGELTEGIYRDQLELSSNSPDQSQSTAVFELEVLPITEITRFLLINATTDEEIQILTEGTVIDLADFENNSFNILAVPGGVNLGSVVFDFNGVSGFITENVAPYALGGDISGDFKPLALPFGFNTVTANAYTGLNGTGELGMGLTVNFEVIDSVTPYVTDFVLVNADTDTVIGPLIEGMVINTTALGTANLNIIAATGVAPVGIVAFDLNGVVNFRTERAAPFTLAGDLGDDFRAIQFPEGANTLTARPGSPDTPRIFGEPFTMNFDVVSTPVPTTLTIASVSPNPTGGIANFVVKNQKEGQLELYLVDLLGTVILGPPDFTIDADGNGSMNISLLQEGTYILTARDSSGSDEAYIVKK